MQTILSTICIDLILMCPSYGQFASGQERRLMYEYMCVAV